MSILTAPQWLFRRSNDLRQVVDVGLAYVPNIDKALTQLAEMARDEDWGPSNTILYNYLDYTVHRLIVEDKIVETVDGHGNSVAAFNTGLLTDDVQPIYGFLNPNPSTLPQSQPWCFGRWALSSDFVMSSFSDPPGRARFWHESPAELMFNVEWGEPEVRLEHIIDHNVGRFPRLLQNLPHLRKHALNDAIDDAVRQVEADPHLAAPAYYPKREAVSLLLPLRLIHADVVDLALVIGPFGERRYAAWTVYKLDWAYKAARLIKAPSVDWMGPTVVSGDSESEPSGAPEEGTS